MIPAMAGTGRRKHELRMGWDARAQVSSIHILASHGMANHALRMALLSQLLSLLPSAPNSVVDPSFLSRISLHARA